MAKAYQSLLHISDSEASDKYYSVDGASKTLDGLDVKVSNVQGLGGALAEISVIRRNGTLIGDRPWQEAVAPGSMFIAKKYLFLSPFQDEMEFSSVNDFGKHLISSVQTRGTTQLLYTEYDNAMSVDVKDISVEPSKTLYSRVFFGSNRKSKCFEKLEAFIYDLGKNPLEIVKSLKEIE